MTSKATVKLSAVVGKGYADYWRFKGRYRVVKGGRASKKSTTTALWVITNMMKYPEANTLVLRRFFKDHKDSTYAQLEWAINRLQVQDEWQCKLSPLEMIYKRTGQKILFRGLDKPQSVTSITVKKGYLCWAWFEEAYQIMNKDDFDKVDISIRGNTGGLFKQLTLTFNPWNEKHWLNHRFFQKPHPNSLSLTTNYLCNEFLGDDDRELFEWMKTNSPRRYKSKGLVSGVLRKGRYSIIGRSESLTGARYRDVRALVLASDSTLVTPTTRRRSLLAWLTQTCAKSTSSMSTMNGP